MCFMDNRKDGVVSVMHTAMASGYDCGFVGAILWAAALFTYNDVLLGVLFSLLLLFCWYCLMS